MQAPSKATVLLLAALCLGAISVLVLFPARLGGAGAGSSVVFGHESVSVLDPTELIPSEAVEASRLVPEAPRARTVAALSVSPDAEQAVRTLELRGSVVLEGSGPLSGVDVILKHGSYRSRAMTNTEGAFRFAQVRESELSLVLEASSLPPGVFPAEGETPIDGFALADEEGTEVHQDPVVRVELIAVRGAQVQGFVRGADGTAQPGLRVALRPARGPSRLTRTDEDGFYRFADLAPGSYAISADSGGALGAGQDPAPRVVQLSKGALYEMPDLVLGTGGDRLTGRVVDERGRPMEGLLLICTEVTPGPSAVRRLVGRTGADGDFCLGRAPASDWKLTVREDPAEASRGMLRIDPTELRTFATGGQGIEVALGELVIPARAPFLASMEIRVDRRWAREAGIQRLHLDVVQSDPPEGGAVRGTCRVRYSERRLKPAGPGQQDPIIWCEWGSPPSVGPVVLELRLQDAPPSVGVKHITVSPSPGGQEEIFAAFP